ncbi:MAG: D-sedoheptulose 7-phosphate isomerase [Gammaproteobacteria bacterium]|nr:D-sedoheptulose 7-phosphate isomerase [Gammaproteobacteria bacterium]
MAGLKPGYAAQQFRDSLAVKQAILDNDDLLGRIEHIAALTIDAYRAGNKVLIAGNGGSAADAQHIAAEFVSRFSFDRPALPALALTTDTSILTAIGNDYGYETLFSRQLNANAREKDIFVAISTSGNSPNILHALHTANDLGLVTVGLTGGSGGKMAGLCEHCLVVPSSETPRIQESHIVIGHILCWAVEQALFGKD